MSTRSLELVAVPVSDEARLGPVASMRPALIDYSPTLILTNKYGSTIIVSLTEEQQQKINRLYSEFLKGYGMPETQEFSFDFMQLIAEDSASYKTHCNSNDPKIEKHLQELRKCIADILKTPSMVWHEIPTGVRAHLSAQPNFALKKPIRFNDEDCQKLKAALGTEPVTPRVKRAETLIEQIKERLASLKDHKDLQSLPQDQSLLKQGRLQAIDQAIESFDQLNTNAVYFAVGCPDQLSAKERFGAAQKYFGISPGEFGIKDTLKMTFGFGDKPRDLNGEYLRDAARLHCDTRPEYESASFELGSDTEFRRDGVEVFLTRLTKAGNDQEINAVLNNEHLFAAAFGDLHKLDQEVLREALRLTGAGAGAGTS